jgi:hypothetical protein
MPSVMPHQIGIPNLFAYPPSGGKGKGWGKGQSENPGRYGDTQFVNNTVPPLITPVQTLTAAKPTIITEGISNSNPLSF